MSLIKEGPFAHFDCDEACTPEVPKKSAMMCVRCQLPSHRGLPPFKSMVDIEGTRMYYHEVCPPEPEKILEQIKVLQDERLERDEKAKSLTFFRKPKLRGQPWKRS